MLRVASLFSLLLLAAARPRQLSSHRPGLAAPHHHHHHDERAAASVAVESYLSPSLEVAASEAVGAYLGPALEVVDVREAAASEVVGSYLGPAQPEEEPAASRLAPAEAPAARALDSYFGPSGDTAAPSITVESYYSPPRAEVLQPEPSVARAVAVRAPTAAPVAILRSSNTGPQDGNYAYSFETENGISQSVEGRMKMVDDTPVYVMQGEYSYPGPDGNMWKVEWYADETGYHPSAPFLPKSVVPNHPEVAAAVAAQLRFAEEERAAASITNEVFALPESGLAGYGDEDLSAYSRY